MSLAPIKGVFDIKPISRLGLPEIFGTDGAIGLTGQGFAPGIRYPVVRPTFNSPPTASLGYFRSSDPALNEIRGLGAFTLEFNRVPVRSLPTSWTATPQGGDVKGSTFSVYQGGTAWTNYVVNFDAKMVRNETGWMVYGVPLFGFRFTLAADNDVVGPPNTLRITEPFSAGAVLQASRKAESKLSEKRTKQNNVVRTVLKINIALI